MPVISANTRRRTSIHEPQKIMYYVDVTLYAMFTHDSTLSLILLNAKLKAWMTRTKTMSRQIDLKPSRLYLNRGPCLQTHFSSVKKMSDKKKSNVNTVGEVFQWSNVAPICLITRNTITLLNKESVRPKRRETDKCTRASTKQPSVTQEFTNVLFPTHCFVC